MPGKASATAALAFAAVVAYSIWFGAYWLTDVAVLSIVAFVVAFMSLAEGGTDRLLDILGFSLGRARRRRGTKTTSIQHDQKEQIPRSRITHYVVVSRIKSTLEIAKRSDNPFERVLFSRPEWRTLNESKLREIARNATSASMDGES